MPANRFPDHTRILVIAIIGLFVIGVLVFFAVTFLRFLVVGEGMH